jgi:hypothetical protein
MRSLQDVTTGAQVELALQEEANTKAPTRATTNAAAGAVTAAAAATAIKQSVDGDDGDDGNVVATVAPRCRVAARSRSPSPTPSPCRYPEPPRTKTLAAKRNDNVNAATLTLQRCNAPLATLDVAPGQRYHRTANRRPTPTLVANETTVPPPQFNYYRCRASRLSINAKPLQRHNNVLPLRQR